MKVLFSIALMATWQVATAQPSYEIPPELLLAALGMNPPCKVCSDMSDEPIDVDGLEFAIPYIETTCKTLFYAGEQGYIPPEMCLLVQELTILQNYCGCDSSASGGESQNREIENVCHVCGTPTSKITNNDVMIPIPAEFGIPVPFVSCLVLEQAALNGLLPPEACTIPQSTPEFAFACGCEEFGDSLGEDTVEEEENADKEEDIVGEDVFEDSVIDSEQPSDSPSYSPILSDYPSIFVSDLPSDMPSDLPSDMPSLSPSSFPTTDDGEFTGDSVQTGQSLAPPPVACLAAFVATMVGLIL